MGNFQCIKATEEVRINEFSLGSFVFDILAFLKRYMWSKSRGTDEFKMEYTVPVDINRISQEQQGNGRHLNVLS